MTRSLRSADKNIELSDVEYSQETDINVRVIALAVTAVVLILVAIFFIKTYASQKQDLVRTIRSESTILEIALKDTFSKTQYIMGSLTDSIVKDHKDTKHVADKLKIYEVNNKKFNLLPWNELIWLDELQRPIASSNNGKISGNIPISRESLLYSKRKAGKVIYWADLSREYSDFPLLYTIMSVRDNEGKFIGTLAISYNANELNKNLSRYKRHNATNFVILDRSYRIIMQSKPALNGIGIKHDKVNAENLIKTISVSDPNNIPTSYIDMLNGANYFIKQIEGEPFILLTNFDTNEVRKMIFNSVVMKFLEISIFASMFILLIVAIYKRETWLRSKAEKAYEFAIRATEAKSDFLAFTAHEIRSPLGFIMTGSEIMCKKMLGPISDKYLEYLQGIHKSAKLILEFISDILDEEHIIAGNFKIVESQVDLKDIIDEAISQNKSRYAHKNITINKDIQKKLPKITCDSRRILQVINNLVSNSIKYSRDDPTVDISAKVVRNELVLKIEDHGIGMSEDEIKVALTKYGTVHKAPLSLIESYGLGLAIVKLLLDAHEASFSVESKVNVGTIVTIIFPQYNLESTKEDKRKKSNEKH